MLTTHKKKKMADDIEESYRSSLEDLNFNSKPQINMLTMLAEDHEQYAPVVVRAIEQHIDQVKASHKLPVMYLIDSIVKNLPTTQYPKLLSQNIVQVFGGVFQEVDERTRGALFKLRQTWKDIFPSKKLYGIDVRVHSMDPAWPITAKPQEPGNIHVNPKFLVQSREEKEEKARFSPPAPSPPPDDTEELMRQQLQAKEQELQKLKLELELAETRAKLEQQKKQLEEKHRAELASRPSVIPEPTPTAHAVPKSSTSGPRDPRLSRDPRKARDPRLGQSQPTTNLEVLQNTNIMAALGNVLKSPSASDSSESTSATEYKKEKVDKSKETSKKSPPEKKGDSKKFDRKNFEKKDTSSTRSPKKDSSRNSKEKQKDSPKDKKKSTSKSDLRENTKDPRKSRSISPVRDRKDRKDTSKDPKSKIRDKSEKRSSDEEYAKFKRVSSRREEEPPADKWEFSNRGRNFRNRNGDRPAEPPRGRRGMKEEYDRSARRSRSPQRRDRTPIMDKPIPKKEIKREFPDVQMRTLPDLPLPMPLDQILPKDFDAPPKKYPSLHIKREASEMDVDERSRESKRPRTETGDTGMPFSGEDIDYRNPLKSPMQVGWTKFKTSRPDEYADELERRKSRDENPLEDIDFRRSQALSNKMMMPPIPPSILTTGMSIPQELQLDRQQEILMQAELQKQAGTITHEQHQELLRQLDTVMDIQRSRQKQATRVDPRVAARQAREKETGGRVKQEDTDQRQMMGEPEMQPMDIDRRLGGVDFDARKRQPQSDVDIRKKLLADLDVTRRKQKASIDAQKITDTDIRQMPADVDIRQKPSGRDPRKRLAMEGETAKPPEVPEVTQPVLDVDSRHPPPADMDIRGRRYSGGTPSEMRPDHRDVDAREKLAVDTKPAALADVDIRQNPLLSPTVVENRQIMNIDERQMQATDKRSKSNIANEPHQKPEDFDARVTPTTDGKQNVPSDVDSRLKTNEVNKVMPNDTQKKIPSLLDLKLTPPGDAENRTHPGSDVDARSNTATDVDSRLKSSGDADVNAANKKNTSARNHTPGSADQHTVKDVDTKNASLEQKTFIAEKPAPDAPPTMDFDMRRKPLLPSPPKRVPGPHDDLPMPPDPRAVLSPPHSLLSPPHSSGEEFGDQDLRRGPRPEFDPRAQGPPDQFGPHGPPQDFDPRGPPHNFGPMGPPQDFDPRQPPHEHDPRRRSNDIGPMGPHDEFGPRGPPQDRDPRGPPNNFESRGPPRDFDPRGLPRDHDPRGPPREHDPRGPPRDFDPRGPAQDHDPRGPPHEFDPRGPPRDHDPRGPPRDHDPRGPPRDHDPRGPPRDFDPRGQPMDHDSRGPPMDHDSRGPPREFDPRGRLIDHGPRGPPQELDARGSPQDFGPRGPRDNFGPRGPQDFDPRGPSKDMDPRHPRGGPHDDFGPRGPQDMGLRGPRDDMGPRGPRDDFGQRGPRDDMGPRAPRDDFGPRGHRDDMGPRGPRNDFDPRGPRDDMGPRGPRDDMGPRGPRDDMGPRGPRDDMGPRGPRDDLGPRGPRDDMGPRGPRDDMGPRGPRDDFVPRGMRDDFDQRGPPREFDNRGPRDGPPREPHGSHPRNQREFDQRGPPADFDQRGPRPDFDRHGPPRDRPGFNMDRGSRSPPQDFDHRGPPGQENMPPPRDFDPQGRPRGDRDQRGPRPDFDQRGPGGPGSDFGGHPPGDRPGRFQRRDGPREGRFNDKRKNFNDGAEVLPGYQDFRWKAMRGFLQTAAKEEFVVDGRSYEIKIGSKPRKVRMKNNTFEVFADPNQRAILINGELMYKFGEPIKKVQINRTNYTIYFHGLRKSIWIDGSQHELRVDAPPRNIVTDGKPRGFQIDGRDMMILVDRLEKGQYGGPPRQLLIENVVHEIRFDAPPRTILIDGQTCDLILDRAIPVVMYNGKPHGIRFDGQPREMIIDDYKFVIPMDDAIKVRIKHKPHFLAFGGPAHEVVIDGKRYEIKFDNVPREIVIGHNHHVIRLEGPTPNVKILDEVPIEFENDMFKSFGMQQPVVPLPAPGIQGPPGPGGPMPGPVPVPVQGPGGPMMQPQPIMQQPGMVPMQGGQPMPGQPMQGQPVVSMPGQPMAPMQAGQPVVSMQGGMMMAPNQGMMMQGGMMQPGMQPMMGGMPMQQTPMGVMGGMQQPGQMFMQQPAVPVSQGVGIPNILSSLLPGAGGMQAQTPAPGASNPMDVGSLFQKLVAAGIIPKGQKPPEKPAEPEAKPEEAAQIRRPMHENRNRRLVFPPKQQAPEKVPTFVLGKLDPMKKFYKGVIQGIYEGIQCSSCGTRFRMEDTNIYREHLDWHFRQNKKGQNDTKVARNRNWYYKITDWIQFEEFGDVEERSHSQIFDSMLHGGEETKKSNAPTTQAAVSCPAATGDEQEDICCICREPFEQYWNEEAEDWHLRDAIRIENKTYHPVCYEDAREEGTILEPSPTPTRSASVNPLDKELREASLRSEPPPKMSLEETQPVRVSTPVHDEPRDEPESLPVKTEPMDTTKTEPVDTTTTDSSDTTKTESSDAAKTESSDTAKTEPLDTVTPKTEPMDTSKSEPTDNSSSSQTETAEKTETESEKVEQS